MLDLLHKVLPHPIQFTPKLKLTSDYRGVNVPVLTSINKLNINFI